MGIPGGVRIEALNRCITPQEKAKEIIELTRERWILKICRTVIGTMQGVAWRLPAFFAGALIACAVRRGFELKRAAGAVTGS